MTTVPAGEEPGIRLDTTTERVVIDQPVPIMQFVQFIETTYQALIHSISVGDVEVDLTESLIVRPQDKIRVVLA